MQIGSNSVADFPRVDKINWYTVRILRKNIFATQLVGPLLLHVWSGEQEAANLQLLTQHNISALGNITATKYIACG
jgi:hypothetical protein